MFVGGGSGDEGGVGLYLLYVHELKERDFFFLIFPFPSSVLSLYFLSGLSPVKDRTR